MRRSSGCARLHVTVGLLALLSPSELEAVIAHELSHLAHHDGKVIRKGAKVGRSFTVRFFTRDGQKVTKKLVLRAERKDDDAGRPLAS